MTAALSDIENKSNLLESIFSMCCGTDSTELRAASPPKLIIAGAPASGKGTQCELIKEQYGVVHLSTGDMLRAAVAAGSDVGRLAKEYMDAGKLVPDEVIIGVVSASQFVYPMKKARFAFL